MLALAAFVLGAHFLVSRQDHELIRRQIVARVETYTGLELEIVGSLELPYSLLPTVVFHDIELSNPEPKYRHAGQVLPLSYMEENDR